ncbi:YkuS family protein [Thermosediminibacter oceani]|uniref:Uncharacterized protein n=1 Tax=Thermosediminibacter oceani (strain ATCC BAA-1034 / DSM 16646 / JW/IW-1228P) TaxID=555079 RepID=D9S195_THEOJ|nr:YkuS family protein [Thermosediminibacter oceani]ADL08974.1 conserved hypothetical protein [Thermosediminibacter oceani DSM 16646]
MSRVIALEDGLEDLGEYLRQRGFITVPWSQVSGPVDAVVYTGRKLKDIVSKPYNSFSEEMSDELTPMSPFGVLLVNAEERTPEEVYEIIKNRVYEHFI